MSYAPLMKWEKLGHLDPALEQLKLPVPYWDVPPDTQPPDPGGAHTHPSPPFLRLCTLAVTPSSDTSSLKKVLETDVLLPHELLA